MSDDETILDEISRVMEAQSEVRGIQPAVATHRPEMRLFPIKDLIPAPFQPSRRFSKRRMDQLEAEILRLGLVAQPPLVSAEGRILDGHRRITILKKLGVTYIWCIVLPTGLVETFIALNSSSEVFNGLDWAEAISKGINPALIPGKAGERAQKLNEIGGDDIFHILRDNSLGVNIYENTKRIAVRVGLSDNDGIKRTLMWMIEYNGQKRAREALSTEGTDVLRLAIERHKPLLRRDGEWVLGG